MKRYHGGEYFDLEAAEDGKYIDATTMPAAWLDVIAERERQIAAEGWTPEHDDEHDTGELAAAAACYALSANFGNGIGSEPPSPWPWDDAFWKPKDERSNLLRAGALILAEIERLDRAKANGK